MQTSTSASAAASISKTDDSAATRLKALQDQIAARKRKRASEVASEDVKGKGRAVTFAENEEGASTSTGIADSSSVLKPARTTQKDAYKQAEASVSKVPARAKTTAKKRYLKNKLERRKARKRAANETAGSEAREASLLQPDDADDVAEPVQETAEDKKARKRAKRDERNAARAAAALAGDESVNMLDVEELAIASTSTAGAAGQEPVEATRAEKKSRKATKTGSSYTATNGDVSMQDVDGAELSGPVSRKEKRQEAIIANMKAAQEKANKKALKAAQKAKYRAEALGLEEDEAMDVADLPPTQPDALPRFPAPQQPLAPSQRELDELTIASDLKDAILVDQADLISLEAYQKAAQEDCTKLADTAVERLEEMGFKELFAVQAAVLPILLKQRELYLPLDPPRDVCVSAPTGSGKTLGYVVPIVEVRSQDAHRCTRR